MSFTAVLVVPVKTSAAPVHRPVVVSNVSANGSRVVEEVGGRLLEEVLPFKFSMGVAALLLISPATQNPVELRIAAQVTSTAFVAGYCTEYSQYAAVHARVLALYMIAIMFAPLVAGKVTELAVPSRFCNVVAVPETCRHTMSMVVPSVAVACGSRVLVPPTPALCTTFRAYCLPYNEPTLMAPDVGTPAAKLYMLDNERNAWDLPPLAVLKCPKLIVPLLGIMYCVLPKI